MFKTLSYNGVLYDNYEINEDGEVRNKSTGKLLKKSIFKDGYYHITLSLGKRGNVKSIRLHKALAEAFIPNPNNLPIVDHIDEDKLNYSLNNLQWVTAKENTIKHWNKELKNNLYCNNRKLTDVDVKYIRDHLEISQRDMAKIFNVSSTTINNVRNYYFYK